VKCIDGETRLCIIRKKFKGRSKRDNMITNGSYVLVGVRDWEVVEVGKKRKCDLLEVYSSSDIEQIKKYLSPEEWEIIRVRGEDLAIDDDHDDGITFMDSEMAAYVKEQEELVMENKKAGEGEGSGGGGGGGGGGDGGGGGAGDDSSSSDEEIDVDDI